MPPRRIGCQIGEDNIASVDGGSHPKRAVPPTFHLTVDGMARRSPFLRITIATMQLCRHQLLISAGSDHGVVSAIPSRLGKNGLFEVSTTT